MMAVQIRTPLLLATLLATSLLAVAGCDPSVTVVTPSDQSHYSLFGTLNVGADTQVVRVDPHIDTLDSPSLDATVVLKNLETGNEVTLRDSIITIGDERLHNFWTRTPIQPSTSYEVSVRREGGRSVTTATTTTPSDPPQIQTGSIELPCLPRDRGNELYVDVRGAEHLAGVALTYWTQPPATREEPAPPPVTDTFTHSDAIERDDDHFVIPVDYAPDLRAINPEPRERRQCADEGDFARPYAKLMVAAGGPNWPEWLDAPLNEVARPDAFSNVKGGHGYVGGIYPDTIRVPISTPIAR